jgi:hypothetical protein
MSEAVKTWRYHLKGQKEPYDSWTIAFVDSTGCVAILSDYGDWCYRWSTPNTGHGDFREFFIGIDASYAARKLANESDRNQFDGEATRKRIRQDILRDRRARACSADWARQEWDLVDVIEDDHECSFSAFLAETSIEDAFEYAITRMGRGLTHWVHVSLPRLQQLIREELASEAGETL